MAPLQASTSQCRMHMHNVTVKQDGSTGPELVSRQRASDPWFTGVCKDEQASPQPVEQDDSALSGPELRHRASGFDAWFAGICTGGQVSTELCDPGTSQEAHASLKAPASIPARIPKNSQCAVINSIPYCCRPLEEGPPTVGIRPSQQPSVGYPRAAGCLSCGLTEFKPHNDGTKGIVPFWKGVDMTCCGVQCHGSSGTAFCCLTAGCACCIWNGWASLVHRCTRNNGHHTLTSFS